jgi:hypothetical protein
MSDMDGTKQPLTPKERLSAYREIVERFLPFVLIRCSKFTNSKRLAEYIAVYTFIGVYRQLQQIYDASKMPAIIDSMLNIVGRDFADGPDTIVGDKLFEGQDKLRAAKTLAEMDMEKCLSLVYYMDDMTGSFDRGRLELVTAEVTDYLAERNKQP